MADAQDNDAPANANPPANAQQQPQFADPGYHPIILDINGNGDVNVAAAIRYSNGVPNDQDTLLANENAMKQSIRHMLQTICFDEDIEYGDLNITITVRQIGGTMNQGLNSFDDDRMDLYNMMTDELHYFAIQEMSGLCHPTDMPRVIEGQHPQHPRDPWRGDIMITHPNLAEFGVYRAATFAQEMGLVNQAQAQVNAVIAGQHAANPAVGQNALAALNQAALAANQHPQQQDDDDDDNGEGGWLL